MAKEVNKELVDYYEILGLTSDCSNEDIRRSYRRLALLCHPDKNPPSEKEKASKLFKIINEAFVVLSDESKRYLYDVQREAEIRNRSSCLNDYNLVFTSDRDRASCRSSFSPNFSCSSSFHTKQRSSPYCSSNRFYYQHHDHSFEDVRKCCNRDFSNYTNSSDNHGSSGKQSQFQSQFHGHSSNSSPYWNNRKAATDNSSFKQPKDSGNQSWQSQYRRRQRFRGFDYGTTPRRDERFSSDYFSTARKRGEYQGNGDHSATGSAVVYITPLMFILFLLVVNSLIENQSLFSLSQDYYYTQLRQTNNKRVSYYVNENFLEKFEGSLVEFENHVELVYRNYLQSLCDKEHEYKYNNMNKAKYFKDNEMLYELENMKLPHCVQFQQFIEKF